MSYSSFFYLLFGMISWQNKLFSFIFFGFKVLTACAEAPKTVEILFNSYTLVPVTSKWVEAIPEDIFHVSLSSFYKGFCIHYKTKPLETRFTL